MNDTYTVSNSEKQWKRNNFSVDKSLSDYFDEKKKIKQKQKKSTTSSDSAIFKWLLWFSLLVSLDVRAEDAKQIVCARLICFLYPVFFALFHRSLHLFSVFVSLYQYYHVQFARIGIVAIEELRTFISCMKSSLLSEKLQLTHTHRKRGRDWERDWEKTMTKKKQYLHVYIFQRFSFYFHLIS